MIIYEGELVFRNKIRHFRIKWKIHLVSDTIYPLCVIVDSYGKGSVSRVRLFAHFKVNSNPVEQTCDLTIP